MQGLLRVHDMPGQPSATLSLEITRTRHIHVVLQPHPRILQLLPQLRKQNLHLLGRPSAELGQGAQRDGLQAFQELDEVEHANLLELLVLGPGAGGNGKQPVRDVGKAGVLDPALELRAGLRVEAGAGDARDELVAPPVERRAGSEVAAVRVEAHLEVLELHPSARLGVPAGMSARAAPSWGVEKRTGRPAASDAASFSGTPP